MSEVRVNLETRRKFAELLRQFLSGRMTNYVYDDRACQLAVAGDDDATFSIYWAAWHLYCDIHKHTMTTPDRRVPRHVRRVVARMIVFLRSDSPHTPPNIASPWRSLLRRPLFNALGCLILAGALALWTPFASIIPALASAMFFTRFLFPAPVTVARRDDLAELFSPDSTQCWPFPSQEALAFATQTPTYLRGSAA